MPEGIITRRLCIRGKSTLKFDKFNFTIKGLDNLSRSVITDKTILRAMFLFNH